MTEHRLNKEQSKQVSAIVQAMYTPVALDAVPDNAKLCYVETCEDDAVTCYFTTAPLNEQWGDDWNDTPFEHNAGTPYAPSIYHYTDGTKGIKNDWDIASLQPNFILYQVDITTAALSIIALPNETLSSYDGKEEVCNSTHSVQSINRGYTPWLTTIFSVLFAGTSPEQMKVFLKDAELQYDEMQESDTPE
jgi:hypothetical protein